MKDTGKLRWALGLFVALSFAAVGVACDDDGDDVVTPDAAVDAAVLGGDTAKPTDAPADAVKSVAVGTVCYLQTDCGGASNYCLKNPPNPSPTIAGTCNYLGCNTKAGSCPMTTTCVDVSKIEKLAPVGTFLCIDNKLLMPPDGGTDAGTDAAADAANN